MKINIATWNVLHIIHEINHNLSTSLVIKDGSTFNEKERTSNIYQKLLPLIENNYIICLQEVYGDLRDELNKNIDNYYIFEYQLPRIPKITYPSLIDLQIYNNINEYLLVLIPKIYNYTQQINVQYKDNGKSALVVIGENLPTIVNTHLPFKKDERINALTILYQSLIANTYININDLIIVGDTNTYFSTLSEEMKTIGFDVMFIYLKNAIDTQLSLKKGQIKGKKIDYIIYTKNMIVSDVDVIDVNYISDHNIVISTLTTK